MCLIALLAASTPASARHPARVARVAHVAATPTPTPWSQFRAPTGGLSQVIGAYAGGCIDGATPLPLAGAGYREVHPERNRIFGHPELIEMIRDLGAHARDAGLPALSIGDLGQPRGGPTPSGHASHQTGLDVDVWFTPPWLGPPLSMVDARRARPSPLFDDDLVHLLRLAASDARVDRIFVNPVLKRALCERTVDDFDRAWLRKVRPWYGHDDHFHVRVVCPADSPACVDGPPLPAGDGCDQLGAWLRPNAAPRRSKPRPTYFAKAAARTPAVELPESCRALLDPEATAVSLPAQPQAAR